MENNKKQTAVSWLEQELFRRYNFIDDEFIFHQAKKIELEQHENTWIKSAINYEGGNRGENEISFNNYYEQTYGKET